MVLSNSHRLKHASATAEDEASWQEAAREIARRAREGLSETGRTARDLIVEHPWEALGVALGLGVLLGWLIKRR